MQRQSELEMATHRISSAISSTLELESILQSAVEEVGRALKARRSALVLWQEGTSKPEGMSVYEREATHLRPLLRTAFRAATAARGRSARRPGRSLTAMITPARGKSITFRPRAA